MKLPTIEFDVDDVAFRVKFAVEVDYVVATLQPLDPEFDLLGPVLTMAWKLDPVNLLESLRDGRPVTKGEFFTISSNDDPDDPEEPVGVNVYEDDKALNVQPEFFREVALELARAHLDVVGEDHFPWFEDLSPEVREWLTNR